jgi:7-cyano-7-deazaguanine synthase
MSESSDESRGHPRAVILLSGGLDSAVTLAVARDRRFDCHALTIDYGQRHRAELHAAQRVARALTATQHLVEHLDLRLFGGSALTADIPVPKDQAPSPHAPSPRPLPIPITYVPARNLIFLSLAAAYAEVLAAQDIFLGVNAIDYSGYPDCRPDFIRAFEETARLATRAGIEGRPFRIHTPLISLSKADIIRLGLSLHVDFALTHSCYDPSPEGRACARCDACLLRAQGFADAGLPDPAALPRSR